MIMKGTTEDMTKGTTDYSLAFSSLMVMVMRTGSHSKPANSMGGLCISMLVTVSFIHDMMGLEATMNKHEDRHDMQPPVA